MTRTYKSRVMSIMLSVIAIISFFIGVILENDYIRLREECSSAAEGTVIDIYEHRSGRKRNVRQYELDVMYYVNVEPYTVITSPSTAKAKTGDRVQVFYSPDMPETAYVKGRVRNGATGFAAAAGFAFFAAVNMISGSVNRMKKRKETQ